MTRAIIVSYNYYYYGASVFRLLSVTQSLLNIRALAINERTDRRR